MKIKNMTNANGNRALNQFIIESEKGQTFQSYETIIAFRPADGSTITLDRNAWDISPTTSKFRNLFVGMDSKETKRAIKEGSIILADLN